jgi:hypothetical protein
VFTARYAINAYIKQIRFVFKGLKQSVSERNHLTLVYGRDSTRLKIKGSQYQNVAFSALLNGRYADQPGSLKSNLLDWNIYGVRRYVSVEFGWTWRCWGKGTSVCCERRNKFIHKWIGCWKKHYDKPFWIIVPKGNEDVKSVLRKYWTEERTDLQPDTERPRRLTKKYKTVFVPQAKL